MQKTRKTLALPVELVAKIQSEADADDRSFNNVVVRRLRSAFFGPETVRQSGISALAASKARPARKRKT